MTSDQAVPVRTPKEHRRRVIAVMVVTQLVVALGTATGMFLLVQHLNGNIADGAKIEHMADPKVKVDGPQEPLNILIMGSDSRTGAGNGVDNLGDIGQRSDTTILLHVSADRSSAYGVSLPRDAMVDRPDCQVDGKTIPGADPVIFNDAFSVGGAQCTVQMVESLTNVYIDHFLVLDFNGFKDMVDAVDGVEVCIPKEVDDDEHNIHFDAGVQELTGQDALNYVRERYQLSVTGDIGRMKRQQAFIASMVNKVKSAGTLSQPPRVYSFLNAVTESIQVDEGLDSVGKLFKLATQFTDTGLDKIRFVTVPIQEYAPDPNRLQWTDQADDLWDRIRHDEPLGKEFSEGSVSADEGVGSTDSPSDEPGDGESTSPSDGSTSGSGGSEDPSDSDAEAQERLQAGLCA